MTLTWTSTSSTPDFSCFAWHDSSAHTSSAWSITPECDVADPHVTWLIHTWQDSYLSSHEQHVTLHRQCMSHDSSTHTWTATHITPELDMDSSTRDMTHTLMTSESVITHPHVTWLIRTWYDSYMNYHKQHVRLQLYCVTWLVDSYINSLEHHSKVWHGSSARDMTRTHVTWLIHKQEQAARQTPVGVGEMTNQPYMNSYAYHVRVWHDSSARDMTP